MILDHNSSIILPANESCQCGKAKWKLLPKQNKTKKKKNTKNGDEHEQIVGYSIEKKRRKETKKLYILHVICYK